MVFNPTDQNKIGVLLKNPDGSYGVRPAGAYPLAPDLWTPQRMPMVVVYPRPQIETQAHARHRYMHTEMDYVIPIGVQGGAWPFKFDIIDAPAGATMTQTYVEDDTTYTDLVIPKASIPASGTHSFNIQITDQTEVSVNATWDSTTDNSQFVFVQKGWTGTKTGTFEEPLEDYPDWYGDSQTDATYLNKIIVWRQGNGPYTVRGDAAATSNCNFDVAYKTPSHIGFPGETPVWDCTTAKILYDAGGMNDIFVQNIRFNNARLDVPNAHFFWVRGDTNRMTFNNNYFYNMANPGQSGTDNTSCIFVSSIGEFKSYFFVSRNVFDGINNSGGNGSYMDFYRSDYVLIEFNEAKNSTSDNGIWCKGTRAFVTVRKNKLNDNVSNRQISVGFGSESGAIPHDHELNYNLVVIQTGNQNQDAVRVFRSNFYSNDSYNMFIDRNTIENGRTKLQFAVNELINLNGNVIISDNATTNHLNPAQYTSSISNITDTETGNATTDGAGNLIGAAQTAWEYKRGHKVAA